MDEQIELMTREQFQAGIRNMKAKPAVEKTTDPVFTNLMTKAQFQAGIRKMGR